MKVKKSSPTAENGHTKVLRTLIEQALAKAQYVSTKRSVIRLLHEFLPESERMRSEMSF